MRKLLWVPAIIYFFSLQRLVGDNDFLIQQPSEKKEVMKCSHSFETLLLENLPEPPCADWSSRGGVLCVVLYKIHVLRLCYRELHLPKMWEVSVNVIHPFFPQRQEHAYLSWCSFVSFVSLLLMRYGKVLFPWNDVWRDVFEDPKQGVPF